MTALWPTGSYDVLERDLVVLFCGLNPSIEAATTGHNFGSASNRFWRVLHLAGFTPHQTAAEDDSTLPRYGCGVTAAVGRPTRSASEVRRAEFQRSAVAFERKVAYYRPHTIAFLGKAAYFAMTGLRDLHWGGRADAFGSARAWLLPNPSGLNRAFTLDRLVEHYGSLRADLAQRLARFASDACE
jgi:double-stranded uracil-DNA glycosylase